MKLLHHLNFAYYDNLIRFAKEIIRNMFSITANKCCFAQMNSVFLI